MRPEEPMIENVTAGDGALLAVRRWEGRRPPGFVLVHGLASNLETWGEVAELLAEAGHAVVAYDQRGHGRSERPESGYDLATAVADLGAVIAWSGFDSPVLAGQSWGGNLVIAYAARRDGLAGAACVDGGTIDLAAQFASWDDAAMALRPPALDVGLAEVADRIRATHPDWQGPGITATLANLEEVAGVARNRLPLEAHLALLHTMWQHPPEDDYPEVSAPVLFVLAASGDAGWTAAKRGAVSRAQAALGRATVEWVEGDHDLHVQQPDLVASRLLYPGWR